MQIEILKIGHTLRKQAIGLRHAEQVGYEELSE